MGDEFSDDVPRSVGEARARFNFIADSALARRLQDEEFRGHFSASKQERQLVGSDAKANHDALLDEILEQEALRRENIKHTLMLDEEIDCRGNSMEKRFSANYLLRIRLKAMPDWRESYISRSSLNSERNRLYSRRPYPSTASSLYDSDEERPPTPPPHGRRIVQKEGRGNDRNNAMKTNFV